jgi:DNA-binding NarL/FixJ family response regulator
MTHSPCRIFIVDDHPIFRRGVRDVVAAHAQFTVVGEAGEGPAALEAIKRLMPDVVLLDLNVPGMDGLALARAVRDLRPPSRVLVLTMQGEESAFNAAMDAGAQGYILKENAVEDLVLGIKTVAGGGVYLSPSISSFLVRRHQRASAVREQNHGLASLTSTERQVLRLVAENKTNRQIGGQLFISHRTVETHRANICQKLNLRGARALFQFALENKSAL